MCGDLRHRNGGVYNSCGFSTCIFIVFFFFQAEDGIRDSPVTGVQTCALPIFKVDLLERIDAAADPSVVISSSTSGYNMTDLQVNRSEERRVGKECRSRWSPYH